MLILKIDSLLLQISFNVKPSTRMHQNHNSPEMGSLANDQDNSDNYSQFDQTRATYLNFRDKTLQI